MSVDNQDYFEAIFRALIDTDSKKYYQYWSFIPANNNCTRK